MKKPNGALLPPAVPQSQHHLSRTCSFVQLPHPSIFSGSLSHLGEKSSTQLSLPSPDAHPPLPQGPEPSAPTTQRGQSTLSAHQPVPAAGVFLENTTPLFPQHDLKGKLIFSYQLRQKMLPVLWTSPKIVSFY